MTQGWPRQPHSAVRPLSEIRAVIQAGDVVLTGGRSRMSPAIRMVTRSPVSHAVLMVLNDIAIEADDHKWNMKEHGGGTYLRRLSAVIDDSHNYIAVRRPPTISNDVLRRWANYRLTAHQPFASTGLAMMGVVRAQLLLRNAIPIRLRPRVPLASVEWVADGQYRLMCSELVYRGLVTAGAEIDLSRAVFAEAMKSLLPTTPDVLPVGMTRLSTNPRRELMLARAMSQRARKKAGSGLPRRPDEFIRWAMTSSRDLANQWSVRAHENIPGDHADFVCPGDLLRTPSLIDVCAFEKHRGQWRRVTTPLAHQD